MCFLLVLFLVSSLASLHHDLIQQTCIEDSNRGQYALGGVNQVARCDGDELHTIDGAQIAHKAGLWLYVLHYCFYIRVP